MRDYVNFSLDSLYKNYKVKYKQIYPLVYSLNNYRYERRKLQNQFTLS
jgi:hypothetical protein